jgi:hypothetical protein
VNIEAAIYNAIWRPIRRDPPFCTLRELQDGTYDINDLADFHEVIDVEDENRRLFEASQKKD